MRLTRQQIIDSRTHFFVGDGLTRWEPQYDMAAVIRVLHPPTMWLGSSVWPQALWVPGRQR